GRGPGRARARQGARRRAPARRLHRGPGGDGHARPRPAARARDDLRGSPALLRGRPGGARGGPARGSAGSRRGARRPYARAPLRARRTRRSRRGPRPRPPPRPRVRRGGGRCAAGPPPATLVRLAPPLVLTDAGAENAHERMAAVLGCAPVPHRRPHCTARPASARVAGRRGTGPLDTALHPLYRDVLARVVPGAPPSRTATSRRNAPCASPTRACAAAASPPCA